MLTVNGQPATIDNILELLREHQEKVRALAAVLEMITRRQPTPPPARAPQKMAKVSWAPQPFVPGLPSLAMTRSKKATKKKRPRRRRR